MSIAQTSNQRTVNEARIPVNIRFPTLQVVMHFHGHEQEVLVQVEVHDVFGVEVSVAIYDMTLRFCQSMTDVKQSIRGWVEDRCLGEYALHHFVQKSRPSSPTAFDSQRVDHVYERGISKCILGGLNSSHRCRGIDHSLRLPTDRTC